MGCICTPLGGGAVMGVGREAVACPPLATVLVVAVAPPRWFLRATLV